MTQESGNTTTSVFNIDLDPKLQGADRVRKVERPESRLNTEQDDVVQDTQTRANIHQGSDQSEGTALPSTRGVGGASVWRSEDVPQDASESPFQAGADGNDVERETEDASTPRSETQEPFSGGAVSSGRATTPLNFEESRTGGAARVSENTAPGQAEVDDPSAGSLPVENALGAGNEAEEANMPPVAVDDVANTDEDSAFIIDVLANDSDANGDRLIITDAVLSDGQGAISHDGQQITFNPGSAYDYLSPGEEETVTVIYTVADSAGETSTATLTLTVTGNNDGPLDITLAGNSIAENHAGAAVGALESVDIDRNDTVTYDVSDSRFEVENGILKLKDGVSLDYEQAASIDVTVTARDQAGAEFSKTFTIDVANVNEAPEASDLSGQTAEHSLYEGQLTATDVDGDSLSYHLLSGPEKGDLVINPDGSFRFDPGRRFDGLAAGEEETVRFTYEVSDGAGGTDTATVSLTVMGSNDGPVVGTVDLGATAEDTTFTFSADDLLAQASDVDGDVLTVTSVSVDPAYGTLVDNGAGSYSFTPAENWHGSDVPFSFTVSDGTENVTSTATLEVTAVNDGPVAVEDRFAGGEDRALSGAVLDNDRDVDGDSLSVVAGTYETAEGGTVVLAADGRFTYTPAADFHGEDSFSYTVTDGAATATGTVSLTVSPENDGPVVGAVDLGATAEDTTFTFSADDLLAQASDVDGDALTVTSVSVDPAYGTLVDNGAGSYSFTPAENWHGSDVPFSFTVSDGTENVTSTATLEVTAVNDGPVAVEDRFAGGEDRALSGAVLDNDRDVDGDSLSVVAGTYETAEGGTVVLAADGRFTYTPAADFHGEDSFSYTVTDGAATATGTVSLTVSPENDGPVVGAVDLGATAEDTTFTFSADDLLAQASDVDGDALTVTSVSVDPAYGTLVDNGAGSYSFTPAENWHGSDVPFSFTVSDGTESVTSTATLEVTAVNDGPVAVEDRFAGGEDRALSGAVLDNDRDVDGDSLSVVAGTYETAEGGTVVLAADGRFTYTPAADFHGEDSFSYTVTDGAATATGTVSLTVSPENDGPVVGAVDLGATAEDTTFTFSADDLLAQASDVDGDALTVTSVSVDPAYGTLVDNGAGSYSFTPAENWHGSDVPFSFTVSDGTENVTSTATLEVTAVNDGPVAVEDRFAGGEDRALSGAVLDNDRDVDGDSLSVVAGTYETAEGGTVVLAADGRFTYTPAADFHGEDSFSYTVTDGAATATGTVSLTVSPENDGPVVGTVDLGATAEDTTFTFSADDLLAQASDVDGDALTVTSVSVDPAYGTLVDNGAGSYSFTPAENWHGSDVPFSFTVSDGTESVTSTATLEVTAVNDGPVAVEDRFAGGEDRALSGAVLDNDRDVDGDSLSVVAGTYETAEGGTVVLAADGRFTYTPAADFHGEDSFSYTVTDGAATATGTVSLTVSPENDGPVVGAVDLGATAEDTTFTFSADDLLAQASDVDGDALTVTSVSVDPAYGTLVDNGAGSYSFTPAENWHGSDVPFSFTVSDGTESVTSTATLEVTAVNDGPVAVEDRFAGGEDRALSGAVLDNDRDVDGDSLSVVAGTYETAEGGTVVLAADGRFTYTPAADFHGEDSFSYTVTDGAATATGTVSLTVSPENDGPVVGTVDLGATAEDTTFTFSADDLLAQASDVDGDALTVTSVSVDPAYGTLVDNGAGSYSFTPAENWHGSDVPFSFTVSDGTESVTSTATLEVTAVNDGPVAVEDRFAGGEDRALSGAVLDNDRDVDGDSLSVVAGTYETAEGGTVVLAADGRFTYTPAADFHGEDSFSYTVTDGAATATGTVSLTVSPENDGPVVGAVDLGATAEDTTFTFSADDLLAQASDVDGDALTVTSVSVDPAYGTLVDNGAGSYSFTPAENWHGSDVPFSFTVSDGTESVTSTATLEVTAVNDGPVAVEDRFAGGEDRALSGAVLDNDRDVDGDSLSVVAGTYETAEGGTVVLAADGRFTYTPAADFHGEDSFSYTVTDGAATATGTVSLTVSPENDGPVVGTVDLGATAEDTTFTFSADDLLAQASDVDGDVLTVTSVSVDPAYGTLVDNGAGSYSFTPAENWHGSDVPFSFTVSDGTESVTSTATLEVTAVNDDPVIMVGGSGEHYEYDRSNLVLDPSRSTGRLGDNVSISALDEDGNPSQITAGRHGIGINSRAYGDISSQIDYDRTTGTSEQLVLEFDNPVTNLELMTDRQFLNEGGAGRHEVGIWKAYDGEGNLLAEGVLDPDQAAGAVSSNEFWYGIDAGAPISKIVIEAAGEDYNGFRDSDFAIHSVRFDEADQVPLPEGEELIAAVAENAAAGTVIGDADAMDVDGDSLTYAITSGNEDGAFAINAATGEISVADPSRLDHENVSERVLGITVEDGKGGTDVADLRISVTDVNEAPVVGAVDLGATAEDTAFTFSAADLLAHASDEDGDTLSVTAVSVDPAYGTVVDNGAGSYSFTPAENWSGSDVPFSFTVSDGTQTVQSTATLEVTAVADQPDVNLSHTLTLDASHGNYEIPENGIITIDVSYLSVNAGYKNSHGYYIADADGNPIGGAVIQDNVKDGGSKTVTVDTSQYDGAASLGFFIIPNGDNKNAGLEDDTPVIFQNVDGVWTPFVDGVALRGQNAPAYFSNQDLNPDGQDHFSDSASHGNQNWEDLWGGGDGDYTDVNTQVEVSFAPQQGEVVQAEENVAVDLPQIRAVLGDVDGSESLSVSLSALPQGAVISDGENSYTATADAAAVDVTAWNLDQLQITVVDGTPDFELSVNVTSTETSNGDSQTVTRTVAVDVRDNDFAREEIYGTSANETLTGGEADEFISAYQGNDQLYGGGGDDILHAGDGDDYAEGGLGNDTLYGGTGNDNLHGGAGDDTFIFGVNEGHDAVHGGAGWTDTIQLSDFAGQDAEQGWTLVLEAGSSISSTDNVNGEMLLSEDSSGTIVFEDGGEITFDGIEKIVW